MPVAGGDERRPVSGRRLLLMVCLNNVIHPSPFEPRPLLRAENSAAHQLRQCRRHWHRRVGLKKSAGPARQSRLLDATQPLQDDVRQSRRQGGHA